MKQPYFNKSIFAYALTLGILLISAIWICGEFRVPLNIFDISGILQFPGETIMLLFVSIAAPKYGWQAIHGSGLLNYMGMMLNLLFYTLIFYIIGTVVVKYRKL